MVRAVHLRVLPMTRGECVDGPRPCPLVSCRHHLLLDVGESGRLLKARDFDDDDEASIVAALRDMDATCALDVAARGGMTSRAVGRLIGLRRQGIEEIVSAVGEVVGRDEFDEPDHPEDFYVKYSNMGADELAEVAAELRARRKGR